VAALLHDLGRTRAHGLNHAAVSAEILLKRGLKKAAEIVKVHALPQTGKLSLEAKVLIYADTTTGPDGEPIDPMKKLEFLRRLGDEWVNEEEKLLAKEAYEVKRRVVSEVDTLIKRAMAAS
jgi:HD superfamily phosphodiesterase